MSHIFYKKKNKKDVLEYFIVSETLPHYKGEVTFDNPDDMPHATVAGYRFNILYRGTLAGPYAPMHKQWKEEIQASLNSMAVFFKETVIDQMPAKYKKFKV
jgi:hypothetical protein